MEIRTDKDNRYFRDSDFQLCNFLYAKGQKLVNVDSLENGIKQFVFIKDKDGRLEELQEKYKFADKDDLDLLVQVHVYEEARRQLLSFIKDNSFGRKF